jgi:hypothetical protein
MDSYFSINKCQNVLRRPPTQAEVDAQLAALHSRASRKQLAPSFLNGTEFRQNSGPKLTVFLQYACLLLRDAEQWEPDYWANLTGGTMTVSRGFYDVISSDEIRISLR